MSELDSGAGDSSLSVREAASLLSQPPKEQNEAAEAPAAEPGDPAEQESADEADAAPPERETSGETEGADEPAEQPTIDPPRSWTKEEQEAFKALPPEHQQRIADRERAREVEIRRGQNEAAEIRKAAEAERKAAEQARQQYEAALPGVLQQIQTQFTSEFSDITTWEDLQRLAENDPIRYLRYDSLSRQQNAVLQEAQQAEQRRAHEGAQQFNNFRAEQTKLFLEKAPEFADPENGPKMRAEVAAMFNDVGMSSGELAAMWDKGEAISLHDHRLQLIIRDAVRFRTAQKAAKAATTKPVPPAQRAGVAPSKGERAASNIQELETRLKRSGSAKDAVALLQARRAAHRS
jgi:hypothetical protein